MIDMVYSLKIPTKAERSPAYPSRPGRIARHSSPAPSTFDLDSAVERAKGNFKPGSDIDLTLHGPDLTQKLCNSIAEALDDLLLPYSIDLSVFANLQHPELEAHIQRVGVVFFERDGRDL